MTNWMQQLQALRFRFREVAAAEVDGAACDDPRVVLDVREPQELEAEGWITGSLHLPYREVATRIERLVPERDTPIVAVCAHGQRSLLILEVLEGLGYTNLASLAGGIAAWKEEGHKLEQASSLSTAQTKRYARQLALPEVGVAGQQRLLESRVLVVGLGGLGSPAAMYLAAAGVGTLGVADGDVVEATNVHRQLLHGEPNVGERKVSSATRRLEATNPDVTVRGHDTRLTEGNTADIVAQYELVLDGSDNFETRYLLNEACIAAGVPLVHGSVHRFEGHVSVFAPPEGPCYRCLYPSPPPSELIPNCTQLGVLGVLPGLVGMLQATEALKWLLNLGKPLRGRLLCYDALQMSVRELSLARNPVCPACALS